MKYKISVAVMGLLLIVGSVIVGSVIATVGVANVQGLAVVPETQFALAPSAQSASAQSGAVELVGTYSGPVQLDVTVGGVYSDTLATPPAPSAGTPAPPDLGSIDLSLELSQSGNALSGYVNLDRTLVFSVAHTLGSGAASVKIGPYVSGKFDGTNLTLQSEKVSVVANGRTIQRQFRLTGTSAASNGSQISGEYRETLWGYTRAPVTVIGSFSLQRPVFDDIAAGTTNPAPVAEADQGITAQGKAITINVLANDRAAGGGTLTITSVSKPQFGAASTNGQTVTYTPNANFVGNDSFSYIVSDGQGGVATGSVTIAVNGPGGPNQPPTAANDSATTVQGRAVIIDVLANDADPNGDALSITIDGPPANGTATVSNGQVVYTPNASFTGTDRFTYIASDGKGGTATATVTITVTVSQGGERFLYLPLIWE